MREVPILFNTKMTVATLKGRKTATRRIVKFQNGKNPKWSGYIKEGLMFYNGTNEPCNRKPPCKVGDVLYVRETWSFTPCIECRNEGDCERRPIIYEDKASISEGCFVYRADHEHPERISWRPSIHMPKIAARIRMTVVNIRVEKLQDITEKQAEKEGFKAYGKMSARDCFAQLWDTTVKDLLQYGWEANPWVWVIEFERSERRENYGKQKPFEYNGP